MHTHLSTNPSIHCTRAGANQFFSVYQNSSRRFLASLGRHCRQAFVMLCRPNRTVRSFVCLDFS